MQLNISLIDHSLDNYKAIQKELSKNQDSDIVVNRTDNLDLRHRHDLYIIHNHTDQVVEMVRRIQNKTDAGIYIIYSHTDEKLFKQLLNMGISGFIDQEGGTLDRTEFMSIVDKEYHKKQKVASIVNKLKSFAC